MKRVPPKVIAPLKQFGALWVEVIETLDPESGTTRHFDFVWMRHRTVKGKVEMRLARIVEKPIT